MTRGSTLFFAFLVGAMPAAALAQTSDTPSAGGVAQQFKNGGNSLGQGVSQGATQIGHGFKNGAILTWDAMKNGAHSVANTFNGTDNRSSTQ